MVDVFDVNDQFMRYSKVIARAWQDEEFKKELLDSPLEVLRKWKLQIPTGTVRIMVHEDSPTIKHFVLLSRPGGGSGLTEKEVPEGFICC